MNINEQKNIFSYKRKPENQYKIDSNSFCLNNIDNLGLTNNEKFKKNIAQGDNNSYLFNNRVNNTTKLFNHNLLNEIKYIKNKIYFENKKEKNKNDLEMKSRYKSLEYKKKLLLNSIFDRKITDISNSNNNKKIYTNKKIKNYSYIKPYFNKLGNINQGITPDLKNALNEELKNLQKQYYLIDKPNKKEDNKIKKIKKYGFFDYAEKNTIYNHPQLYYINRNKKRNLPKINFSIKMNCLTESIPDKTELINKKDLLNLNDFIKMKKNKRPIFK